MHRKGSLREFATPALTRPALTLFAPQLAMRNGGIDVRRVGTGLVQASEQILN
jgi:hypothetical protein